MTESDALLQQLNLSPAKRALFAKLMRGKLKATTIPPRQQSSSVPLSFAQERLWFFEQLTPNKALYNEHSALRLQGVLNVAALLQSLNEIVCRHEVLRTTFVTVNGEPQQVIAPSLILELPIVNLQSLPPQVQEFELQRIATEEAQQPLNLKTGPLLRVTLLQLHLEEYILLLTMHHIICDRWSTSILIREVAALYQAFNQGQSSPLPDLSIQYADFSVWQRQWLVGDVLEKQISYWQQQLDGAPTLLNLATDRPRPAVMSYRGAKQSVSLSKQLTEALKTLAQQESATLFMTLLAAFQTLLYRYTQQQDILIGTTIAGRNREELEWLIGFFVNTLVLRIRLDGNPSFRELLGQVREVALAAFAHQDLPFEQLVEKLQPQRHLSYTPLFQVMFQLQNTPTSSLELPDLTLIPLEFDNETAKFDLTVAMIDSKQGLIANIEYNTDIFDAATITRLLGHFQTLLSGIVANPEQCLSNLPLLTAAEQRILLGEWNHTQADYPQNQCIHQLFADQVEKTPDAVAVVFQDESLTYQELNNKANQVAYYLQKQGVDSEVLVGICMERSLEMIVGILGIIKAGGAYLPLDPSFPEDRLSLILKDAQPLVVLTQQQLVEKFPQDGVKIVCLDKDWESQGNQDNPCSRVTSANLAYVIYTSGSTGIPKGVLVTHQALVNHSIAVAKDYEIKGGDRILQFAAISFDVATEELFGSWLGGATVVIQPERLPSFAKFQQFLEQEQITVVNLPTAYWQEWVSYLAQTETPLLPNTLRLLVVGTEQALPEKLALWQKLLGKHVRWLNAYGPTEATIGVTIHEPSHYTENQSISCVPVGRPIANTSIYLLDQYLHPTPIGVPGELYISSVSLARGYLNQPELTAEKFIPHLYSQIPGERLYKTGDLARYLPNGDIELLGRIDNQVKIRGFRIEIGEIEARLNQHPQVREAVVMVQGDELDDKRLIAYVSSDLEQELTVTQLRNFLQEKLPEYMLPSAFVILETLPLTANGKVDRKSLSALEIIRPNLEVAYVMPQTEAEQTIANIWQQALNVEKIGIHDNFFELGGHSLLMVKVHSQLRQIFKTELSILDMFRYPTISSLVEYFNKIPNQSSKANLTDNQTRKIVVGKAQQKKRLQKMQNLRD